MIRYLIDDDMLNDYAYIIGEPTGEEIAELHDKGFLFWRKYQLQAEGPDHGKTERMYIRDHTVWKRKTNKL